VKDRGFRRNIKQDEKIIPQKGSSNYEPRELSNQYKQTFNKLSIKLIFDATYGKSTWLNIVVPDYVPTIITQTTKPGSCGLWIFGRTPPVTRI
jgi:hypothetical protein